MATDRSKIIDGDTAHRMVTGVLWTCMTVDFDTINKEFL